MKELGGHSGPDPLVSQMTVWKPRENGDSKVDDRVRAGTNPLVSLS